MQPTPATSPYAVSVLVLTGGASRRMGRHKPSLEVGGVPIVQRVLRAAGPRPVLVVGRDDDVPDGIPVLVEDPPGGGPVAAIAAGLRRLPPDTEVVVVLAADLPFVTSAHLDRLATAATVPASAPGQGDEPDPAGAVGPAVTVDATGRLNWLCCAWTRPSLEAAVERLGDPTGRSMRQLAAGLSPREVADADGAAEDVDTPTDLERARRRLGDGASPT